MVALRECKSRGCSLRAASCDPAHTVTADDRHPEVIVKGSCDWLWFEGLWGTTPAPVCQTWFHRAETPVSRCSALRVFGHFLPETESM
jgi:hypothetical protein